MYNRSAKQQLPIMITAGGFIRTIGVPFLQPPARHFHHINIIILIELYLHIVRSVETIQMRTI